MAPCPDARLLQLLRDMEESYRLRLEAEVEALERKTAVGGNAEGGGGSVVGLARPYREGPCGDWGTWTDCTGKQKSSRHCPRQAG